MRLTEKVIKALEPPRSGNRITYDGDIPGFGLRVTKGGAKSFILNYRIDGRERRLTLGSWPAWNATGARRRAKELRTSIDRGDDPLDDKQQRRAAASFAAIANEYLDRHAAKKKSGHADRLYLERDVLPEWGNRKAREIQRRDVIRLVENKAQATPKGIAGNYLLSVIRGVFNWAIERDLVEANPCWRVKPPAQHHARDRVLSEVEIRLVWQNLTEAAIVSGLVSSAPLCRASIKKTDHGNRGSASSK